MSHDFRYWAWFTVSVCSIGNTTWFWPVCHIWKKVCKDNQKEKLWNRNRRHTLKLWKWSLEILWFTNSLHAWFFWSVHIIMPVCWLHAGIFSISFSVLLIKRHPYIVYVCGVRVYLFIYLFFIYIYIQNNFWDFTWKVPHSLYFFSVEKLVVVCKLGSTCACFAMFFKVIVMNC